MTALSEELAPLRQSIETGRCDEPFARLNELKAQRTGAADVDYLRAKCFLHWQQPWSAMEALKEELRFHPDNHAAAKLLAELAEKHPVPQTLGDAEFQALFREIRPFTMVGEARLFSLFNLAKQVCQSGLPGNFVECGVAAGGSSALLATVIAQHSRTPRRLFAFDSFEGMPPAAALDQHAGKSAAAAGWGDGTCAAPEESLRMICGKLGVEKFVEPVKGWFADTLPKNRERIGGIALLHMDGDWYSSTRDILENLYDQVAPGGFIQIDDYGYWEGCQRAVKEFEAARSVKFGLHVIDTTGVWLEKSYAQK